MNKYLERASYDWSEDSIRLIHTPTAAAKRTFFYVQEVGYFKTTPPYFTERENLDSYLIVYTVSGKGRLHYRGEEYLLEKGQTFYIHCMEHHYYECCEESEWELLWVHFNAANARGYFEEFVKNGFSIISCEDTFSMESTLWRILALTQKKDVHSEVIQGNLLVNLITELLIQNSQESLSLMQIPSYIKQIVKRLDLHFQEEISLDELSKDVGVSKYYLSREFKKYMGTTMNEYLIINRLNYAKELLKYSSHSVGEIAEACGINHVSHFINLFKEREKITPLQYRKLWN